MPHGLDLRVLGCGEAQPGLECHVTGGVLGEEPEPELPRLSHAP
jgi:hypothetical protein